MKFATRNGDRDAAHGQEAFISISREAGELRLLAHNSPKEDVTQGSERLVRLLLRS